MQAGRLVNCGGTGGKRRAGGGVATGCNVDSASLPDLAIIALFLGRPLGEESPKECEDERDHFQRHAQDDCSC